MRHAFSLVGTAVLSSALTSAFWLVAFNKDAAVEAPRESVPIAEVVEVARSLALVAARRLGAH